MVKRVSLTTASCPVARSLDAIGDWWSLLIVRDALDGLRRFSEFQKKPRHRQGHPDHPPAQPGGSRHSGNRAGLRRQRLSGIRADEKRPRTFSVVVSLRQWGRRQLF